MAFSLTTEQIRKGTKTVTRRMGWGDLKAGEEFCAIVKGMGLKKGETVERLAILRCVSNNRETLFRMFTDGVYGNEEVVKEGFPDWTPTAFIEFFCQSHKGCTAKSAVNRIEFEYVKFLPIL